MYYLKRFLGLREILLMALLFAASMWLYLAYEVFIILIFFGITLLLVFVAIVLFLVTGILGYKHDFEATGVTYHQMVFLEDKMVVTSLDKGGEPKFSEEHLYAKIEKIAIKCTKIYIYAGVAIIYYITLESMKDTSENELAAFLREHISADKFKLKKTIRKYPKKKKIKLGEE